MSFETAIRAVLAMAIVVIVADMARALWLGRVKKNGEIHRRDREARRYWAEMALDAVVVAVFGLALAWAPSKITWPLFLALVLIATARFLLDRRKGSGERIFAQGPGEYLLLILLYGLIVLAAIGFLFLFLR